MNLAFAVLVLISIVLSNSQEFSEASSRRSKSIRFFSLMTPPKIQNRNIRRPFQTPLGTVQKIQRAQSPPSGQASVVINNNPFKIIQEPNSSPPKLKLKVKSHQVCHYDYEQGAESTSTAGP